VQLNFQVAKDGLSIVVASALIIQHSTGRHSVEGPLFLSIVTGFGSPRLAGCAPMHARWGSSIAGMYRGLYVAVMPKC
jgi:hypothetical protein